METLRTQTAIAPPPIIEVAPVSYPTATTTRISTSRLPPPETLPMPLPEVTMAPPPTLFAVDEPAPTQKAYFSSEGTVEMAPPNVGVEYLPSQTMIPAAGPNWWLYGSLAAGALGVFYFMRRK